MISSHTSSVPNEDDVLPGWLCCDMRCSQFRGQHSQACCQRSQVLRGDPEGRCIVSVNYGI
jgi:hypothetical protein